MYTVKVLAKLAGITPRTLHFYDEIGILKPSQVGDNGYRYYGEEAVLRLQQILLFRRLDMSLKDIKKLLECPDFDVLQSLEEHRKTLLQQIAQLSRTVQTVDETLLYLKGERTMTAKQMFAGLTDEQQVEYEKEAMQTYDPATVKISNQKWEGYSTVEKQQILSEGNQIYADLLSAMPEGETSAIVQAVIERWRQHLSYFWTPNAEQLLGLADLYNEDPRFKANYDQLHPDLAEFMRKAVKVYVANLNKIK